MRDRADEVLEQVDAVDLADKPVGEMSAGQQRRIMIGRALVASAGMLLLDEPSNALDLAAQATCAISSASSPAQGTGILLITHHIADIIPGDRPHPPDAAMAASSPTAAKSALDRGNLSDLFKTEVQLTERDGFYHAW